MKNPVQRDTPQSDFKPARLLDTIKSRLSLKSDAELSRFLGINGPLVSRVRSTRLQISAGLLIRLHEATGLSIYEMRKICGDRRQKFRA